MAVMPLKNVSLPTLNLKLLPKLIAILVAFLVIRGSLVFIPAGFVAALYDRGSGVQDRELHEGLNVIIPWWQQAQLFDTRIQEYTMATGGNEGAVVGDDSLDAPTSDGQTVKVDATIIFRINPQNASNIWQEIGPDYISKIIRPITRSQIRMIVSRYTAPEIYSEKRQEAESVMSKEIADLLKDKHIIIDKVLLRGVNFSKQYSQAIEDKVIAEQRVKQAEFEVKEATQRAESKIAEAKGLAEAQALQKQSLTAEYLQLEAIKKWDGKLPTTVAGQSTPFINIK